MDTIEIKAKDGAVITSLATGLEDNNTKAVVIISHGFGEHAGSYTEVAEILYKAGFACIIPNQRGHGLPPEGAKNWHGRIPGYMSFIDDVVSLTEYINDKYPGRKIALYGHSMGGNIVINTLLRVSAGEASKYSCAVLEAPWLGLFDPPNKITEISVRILNKIMPNYRILHSMKSGELSTIPDRAAGYDKDPLYHGYLSTRMLVGIVDACKYALDNAARFPIPAFLASADDDTVVCNKAIKDFTGAAPDKITLKSYKSKHAIHNDASREEYYEDIVKYMSEGV